ncbi:MAG: cytidine deaminase [Clostridia bacterium]|nr:cytidine deaminase [Clostridia bacterium]MBR2324985.1 cytidine deaminase [Clostridia bacterium]
MEKYTSEALISLALEARKNAHCPYSGIAVGAALLTKTGEVFLGANMESASFSPTLCAERVAFGAALSQGHREFLRIAVVGAKKDEMPHAFFPPCGVCRQVMAEFCENDFEILLSDGKTVEVLTLDALLPHRFGKEHF